MSINFPNNPSANTTYNLGNKTWKYNGVAWELQTTTVIGPIGYTGSKGDIGYTGSAGAGSSVTVSTTAPNSPSSGDLWWNSEEGQLKIYYNDGNTSQWVDASSGAIGETGYTGSQGAQGATGFTGSQGATGFTGSKGDIGFTGSKGDIGFTGSQGPLLTGIPQNSQTASYTLQASDSGKHISITTGGVTVPSGVFSIGDTVVVFNNSASNQTITQGSNTTVRWAATTSTGNRTLAGYGVSTIMCYSSNTFVISGAGLT